MTDLKEIKQEKKTNKDDIVTLTEVHALLVDIRDLLTELTLK